MKPPSYQVLCENALAELNTARTHLSEAWSWLQSDWIEGTQPDNGAKAFWDARVKVGEAKTAVDRIKNILEETRR